VAFHIHVPEGVKVDFDSLAVGSPPRPSAAGEGLADQHQRRARAV